MTRSCLYFGCFVEKKVAAKSMIVPTMQVAIELLAIEVAGAYS